MLSDEVKEFCEELHKATRESKEKPDWFLYDAELIKVKMELIRARTEPGSSAHQCPICWLASHKGVNPHNRYIDWNGVRRELGLERWDAESIAKASDKTDGYDPEIREELLLACGLNKQPV